MENYKEVSYSKMGLPPWFLGSPILGRPHIFRRYKLLCKPNEYYSFKYHKS